MPQRCVPSARLFGQALFVAMKFTLNRSLIFPAANVFKQTLPHNKMVNRRYNQLDSRAAVSNIIDSTLRERFALSEFLPGQREIIEAVVSGEDSLVILPTGGGKSLCFQLPALVQGGLTLVVSPLIALMKDQVDALQAKGVRATFINTELSPQAVNARLASIQRGEYEILYVAPERFDSTTFMDSMEGLDIKLLAIDEAHCVSQWGHDFRPSFSRLGRVRALLNKPTTIALTATATRAVQQDIMESLGIPEAKIFQTSVDRPNISIHVARCNGFKKAERDDVKIRHLQKILGDNVKRRPSIVYCASRNNVERVTEDLAKRGLSVISYHAGMLMEERTRAQERFMAGDADIIVATNAFGMGIDRSNIRCIVHYDVPGTVEAYYQEIGRAGRDGLPSTAVLLFSHQDLDIQAFFIRGSYPSVQSLGMVYNGLRVMWLEDGGPTHYFFKASDFLEILNSWEVGGATGVNQCLKLLEKYQVLKRIRAADRVATVSLTGLEPEKQPRGRLSVVLEYIKTQMKGGGGGVRQRKFSFKPAEVCAELEIDRSQLLASLKSLREKRLINYEPPGQSGGISMFSGDAKFPLTQAERDEIQDRHNYENKKLQKMSTFVESNCRRRFLVEHFGQKAPFVECGTCDACRSRGVNPHAQSK